MICVIDMTGRVWEDRLGNRKRTEPGVLRLRLLLRGMGSRDSPGNKGG